MPGHPVPDNCRELSDLKTDPRTIERRVAKKIFVEPDLRALIRGIKTAIETCLREEIEMLCELRVEKERYWRNEKENVVCLDQSRCADDNERTVKVHYSYYSQ